MLLFIALLAFFNAQGMSTQPHSIKEEALNNQTVYAQPSIQVPMVMQPALACPTGVPCEGMVLRGEPAPDPSRSTVIRYFTNTVQEVRLISENPSQTTSDCELGSHRNRNNGNRYRQDVADEPGRLVFKSLSLPSPFFFLSILLF